MAVTTDILRTWRGPRAVMRDQLAMGVREDRALAYLMLACLLVFVAQLPRLSRVAALEGQEFDRLAAYEFMSWLMIWPLFFYVLAGLGYLIMRFLRKPVSGYGARLALFWSFLASIPLGLFYGLLAGLNGPGTGANIVGALWIGVLVFFWVQTMREAARSAGAAP